VLSLVYCTIFSRYAGMYACLFVGVSLVKSLHREYIRRKYSCVSGVYPSTGIVWACIPRPFQGSFPAISVDAPHLIFILVVFNLWFHIRGSPVLGPSTHPNTSRRSLHFISPSRSNSANRRAGRIPCIPCIRTSGCGAGLVVGSVGFVGRCWSGQRRLL